MCVVLVVEVGPRHGVGKVVGIGGGKQSIAWVVDLTKGPTYFVLTFDQIFVDPPHEIRKEDDGLPGKIIALLLVGTAKPTPPCFPSFPPSLCLSTVLKPSKKMETSSPIQYLTFARSNASHAPLVCYARTMASSFGVWKGENPLVFSIPLFLFQVILVVITTRITAFLLRPSASIAISLTS
ncbi:hypothetical protein MUK42_13953 [Musa troglodytarum]|uniref:Uncharacterized protein n=1 Tax=Musa troglodytarum TaxID=320322 RepID=A0A9E7I4Z0_9LILI|nr:hypothetical protein MUK42_13953 [Musa troglodytarum]